jgi:hypothetical protein
MIDAPDSSRTVGRFARKLQKLLEVRPRSVAKPHAQEKTPGWEPGAEVK